MVKEPVCEPIGRTSKGDLVYSMLCRNIPGLAAGTNGYNPLPPVNVVPDPKPSPVPDSNSKEKPHQIQRAADIKRRGRYSLKSPRATIFKLSSGSGR